MDIEPTARKWALKNRADHGSAQAAALIGKVIGEIPSAKSDMALLKKTLEKVAADVNALSDAELSEELSGHAFEKKTEREGLPDLPIQKAVTRVAPNPSGLLHIGHAKNLILCDEYVKKYGGQLILRLEDTDPVTKKPLLEAYAAIPADAKWLACNIGRIVIQSERIPIYYEHAEKLIAAGHAYVCACIPEILQKNREKGIACGCRKQTPVQTAREFRDMQLRTKQGKAVLRIKTDMAHPNASVRDFPIMRIAEGDHPRVGKRYRVWPLYNFAAAIDDHLLGITLVLRGKEHELNAQKQQYIYDYFGWTPPHIVEYGLLKVESAMAHKSDIIRGIAEGKFTGWDDIRLPTLGALRRRGIQPGAIRRYMIQLGIKPRDSKLDWDILYRYNKELLADAPHFFFVENPVQIQTGATESVTLSAGTRGRAVQVNDTVLIAQSDADANPNATVRLKDFINVDLPSGKKSEDQSHAGKAKIQWVAAPGIPMKILHADGSTHEGVAEAGVSALVAGDVVQFERYGFARYDHDENGIGFFYFAHP